VHLKDVIDLDDDDFTEPVPPKRIRQLITIYRATDLEDVLATMQRSGVHVARVFDETGATLGVLFLEDIIEELVGEVHDATRRNAPRR
ncbi:MAG TPA: CBS domain-containing protein, partial [Glaciihabitans sp.]|nr:CBS domain-containing protein [Glaciihabitans sp.]